MSALVPSDDENDDEYEAPVSELSDPSLFEDDDHLLNFAFDPNSVIESAETNVKMLSLDEVPFDRDLKYINVAAGSRQKSHLDNVENGRTVRQVNSILSTSKQELYILDEHYKRLDTLKKNFDGSAGGRGQRPRKQRERKPRSSGRGGRPDRSNNDNHTTTTLRKSSNPFPDEYNHVGNVLASASGGDWSAPSANILAMTPQESKLRAAAKVFVPSCMK